LRAAAEHAIVGQTEGHRMGYEVEMQSTILALLRLFRERARDAQTSAWVIELVADQDKWPGALFDLIRNRRLEATGDAGRPAAQPEQEDRARVLQYAFEELCLKTVFNETDTEYPFDACSPFWVAGSAVQLARALQVPVEAVIALIAPD
jgi:hypothetical protein